MKSKTFMVACVCVYVCGDAKLVNTLSQEEKLGQISYLVCRCITLSTGSLLCLVEVKGHLGSIGVKLWKPCKHDISRREAWTNLILGMYMNHIEYKMPIVFSGGQRLYGVNRSQIVTPSL